MTSLMDNRQQAKCVSCGEPTPLVKDNMNWIVNQGGFEVTVSPLCRLCQKFGSRSKEMREKVKK